MSFLSEARLALDFNKIPDRIELYEQLIAGAETLFEIKGQNLEEACKKHAQDLMVYDGLLQELKTIEDVIRGKLEQIEAELYKKYLETGARALNTREIPQYVKGDPKYVAGYEILLEVVLVRRKMESIVEALKTLGWSLNNIVKIRIAQLDHVTL